MTIKRITFLQELLDFIGLEGRLHLEWISSAEAQKFVQVVSDFTEKIRALGPNPLAGEWPAGKLWTPAALDVADDGRASKPLTKTGAGDARAEEVANDNAREKVA